jgi:hypothetical protein
MGMCAITTTDAVKVDIVISSCNRAFLINGPISTSAVSPRKLFADQLSPLHPHPMPSSVPRPSMAWE